ncbi:hypothetical protein [Brevundimonas sp.]|uniref:hypothetical protein n=1 Tax=Brevundimonas sp. TaxID=1871086 RepID=UPI003919E129
MKIVAAITSAAVLALSGAALAQNAPVPFQDRTERLHLEGRRGPSLFRPGFAVGEYAGISSARSSSTRIPFRSRDFSRADFEVATSVGQVTGDCAGGQSHVSFAWITFDRDELSYVCSYAGAAPANARLSLAVSRGGILQRLQQPQRAGELTWGDITIRAETRYVDGLPWTGGGSVIGYVFTRDGVDVGGLALSGMRPAFYLPPQGSPDRDAVAVLALSLYFFQDPGRGG